MQNLKKFFKKLIAVAAIAMVILTAAVLARQIAYDLPQPLSPAEYYLLGLPKNTAIAPRLGQISSSTHPIP